MKYEFIDVFFQLQEDLLQSEDKLHWERKQRSSGCKDLQGF